MGDNQTNHASADSASKRGTQIKKRVLLAAVLSAVLGLVFLIICIFLVTGIIQLVNNIFSKKIAMPIVGAIAGVVFAASMGPSIFLASDRTAVFKGLNVDECKSWEERWIKTTKTIGALLVIASVGLAVLFAFVVLDKSPASFGNSIGIGFVNYILPTSLISAGTSLLGYGKNVNDRSLKNTLNYCSKCRTVCWPTVESQNIGTEKRTHTERVQTKGAHEVKVGTLVNKNDRTDKYDVYEKRGPVYENVKTTERLTRYKVTEKCPYCHKTTTYETKK